MYELWAEIVTHLRMVWRRRWVAWAVATLVAMAGVVYVLALPDSRIEDNVRLKRVLLDNGCHVPAGTVIGEDPEEDARRFHRTPGGVVVVNRDMLGQEHKYIPTGEIDHSLI